jgi:hypothetical protein
MYRTVADFTVHPLSEPLSRKIKLVRYQENPTPNWGPKVCFDWFRSGAGPNFEQARATAKKRDREESENVSR